VAPPPGGMGQGLVTPPYGVASPWLLSVSALDSVLCRENRNFGFVLSNSENISCVGFLKHKNSREWGTGTMASL
jgi:hypothetical protein